ncbi:MAG TPA: aminopeptidase P family N-terminal domain-containing protein [Gaiellaceae bacterium]
MIRERKHDVVRPAELAFSAEEFEGRLTAVREGMERRGTEVLLLSTPENVTYLTGYETIGYSSYLCLVVSLDREPVLVVREMELDVARGTTWLQDFATVTDGQDPSRARGRCSTWLPPRRRRWESKRRRRLSP